MAGKKEEASKKQPVAVLADGETWAVEVLETAGLKGNTDMLALVVADRAALKGRQVNIKLVNVATLVPCGLGGSLPVSQVDAKTIKAHEVRTFKAVVAPLLSTSAGKKAAPKYIPARNDKREDGLREVVAKSRAQRLYLHVKKTSTVVEKLVLEMPGGCTVVGVCGGKRMVEMTAENVDVFDSSASPQGKERTSIDFFDDGASEMSASQLGQSARMTTSLSRSFHASCHVNETGSLQITRRGNMGDDDDGAELARARLAHLLTGASPSPSVEFINPRMLMNTAHGMSPSPSVEFMNSRMLMNPAHGMSPTTSMEFINQSTAPGLGRAFTMPSGAEGASLAPQGGGFFPQCPPLPALAYSHSPQAPHHATFTGSSSSGAFATSPASSCSAQLFTGAGPTGQAVSAQFEIGRTSSMGIDVELPHFSGPIPLVSRSTTVPEGSSHGGKHFRKGLEPPSPVESSASSRSSRGGATTPRSTSAKEKKSKEAEQGGGGGGFKATLGRMFSGVSTTRDMKRGQKSGSMKER